jgi:hypothetical protein
MSAPHRAAGTDYGIFTLRPTAPLGNCLLPAAIVIAAITRNNARPN